MAIVGFIPTAKLYFLLLFVVHYAVAQSRRLASRWRAEEKGLNYCELNLPDICTRRWPLAPAHRHKRAWYKGDVDLLSDFSQWVAACQSCHNFIEHKPMFTEELFIQLRPAKVQV